MKKIAFLFPGQGVQFVGMGKDFYENFSEAKELLEESEEILKTNLKSLLFEGLEEKLKETASSQVSVFLVSAMILKIMQKQMKEISPFVCAGLSLGEYTALFASKKLFFKDVLTLVEKRGKWMGEECRIKKGGMRAILGLNGETVEEVIKSLNPPHNVFAANFNTPGQVVISGEMEALNIAEEALKVKGARRSIPLNVEGAFHSGLMKGAQDKLQKEIESLTFLSSQIALVMNVVGDFVFEIEKIRKYLIDQLTQSVYWQKGIESMEREKIDLYIEIGSGKTLTQMNSKIGVKAPTLSIEKCNDLDNLSEVYATIK